MGWYESIHGGEMGDPVADMIDELGEATDEPVKWDTPADIPSDVRSAIDELYCEGLGRKPMVDDLKAVVGYVASNRREGSDDTTRTA